LDYLTTHTSLSPIRRGFTPGFVNDKKLVHSTRSRKVIKFTSYLSMAGGSLRVLRLLPPLKLVAEILLKVTLNTNNQIKSSSFYANLWIPTYVEITLGYCPVQKRGSYKLLTSDNQFVCLCSVSRVPIFAGVSGMSILNCPFGFL
jgi:hypothetical protein